MNSDELKAKLTHYYNLRNELRNTDIEAEVDKRLEAERDAMRAKVEAEIKADIDKCTHYVELLDELVKEQCDKEDAIEMRDCIEEVHEEVVEDEPVEDEAPVEEAENTAQPDTITVSEEGNQNATN